VSIWPADAAAGNAGSVSSDWPCQWKRIIFDPHRIRTPDRLLKKLGTGDYIGGPYSCAKFGANSVLGGFWANV